MSQLFGPVVVRRKGVLVFHPLGFSKRFGECNAVHIDDRLWFAATFEQNQRDNPHQSVEQVAKGIGRRHERNSSFDALLNDDKDEQRPLQLHVLDLVDSCHGAHVGRPQ